MVYSAIDRNLQSSVCPTLVMANFNMGLLTIQGNALPWSQFVLAWVQRISIFGPSDRRLNVLFSQSLHRKDLGGWVVHSECTHKNFK